MTESNASATVDAELDGRTRTLILARRARAVTDNARIDFG